MSGKIDLHMHTTASDGVLNPMQLLALVRESKLSCFAVTDHDTISGSEAIAQTLLPEDPIFLSGVELSVNCDGADMHLLAYCFDPSDHALCTALTEFQRHRRERGTKMVARLQELGVKIEKETVDRIAGTSVVGRPHVAEALIEHKVVRTIEEAFRKYLAYDSPAYIPKITWNPTEAISAVHAAGGVAIMAHPGIADMQRFIPQLLPLGLDGIEVYHTNHSASQIQHLKQVAAQCGLLITGGTDFHGRPGRNFPLGMGGVTQFDVDALLTRGAEHARTKKESESSPDSPSALSRLDKGTAAR